MSAIDPDCGVNAIVNYTLGDIISRNPQFSVKPDTGELCLASTLDHEIIKDYEFPIVATDRGMYYLRHFFLTIRMEDMYKCIVCIYLTTKHIII